MPQQYSPLAPKASLESSAGSPSKKLHWAFDLQACKDFFFGTGSCQLPLAPVLESSQSGCLNNSHSLFWL